MIIGEDSDNKGHHDRIMIAASIMLNRPRREESIDPATPAIPPPCRVTIVYSASRTLGNFTVEDYRCVCGQGGGRDEEPRLFRHRSQERGSLTQDQHLERRKKHHISLSLLLLLPPPSSILAMLKLPCERAIFVDFSSEEEGALSVLAHGLPLDALISHYLAAASVPEAFVLVLGMEQGAVSRINETLFTLGASPIRYLTNETSIKDR